MPAATGGTDARGPGRGSTIDERSDDSAREFLRAWVLDGYPSLVCVGPMSALLAALSRSYLSSSSRSRRSCSFSSFLSLILLVNQPIPSPARSPFRRPWLSS